MAVVCGGCFYLIRFGVCRLELSVIISWRSLESIVSSNHGENGTQLLVESMEWCCCDRTSIKMMLNSAIPLTKDDSLVLIDCWSIVLERTWKKFSLLLGERERESSVSHWLSFQCCAERRIDHLSSLKAERPNISTDPVDDSSIGVREGWKRKGD